MEFLLQIKQDYKFNHVGRQFRKAGHYICRSTNSIFIHILRAEYSNFVLCGYPFQNTSSQSKYYFTVEKPVEKLFGRQIVVRIGSQTLVKQLFYSRIIPNSFHISINFKQLSVQFKKYITCNLKERCVHEEERLSIRILFGRSKPKTWAPISRIRTCRCQCSFILFNLKSNIC